MRLTEEQRNTIRRLVREVLGASARVLLFGSRVDDEAIGGDVDLLIEAAQKMPLATELSLAAKLGQQLGQPVDVIVTWPTQKSRPIVEIAKRTGVAL